MVGKNRIGAQGTEGFAEVLTNGGWRAVTKSGGYQTGEGAMNYDLDMPPYIQTWRIGSITKKSIPAISNTLHWELRSCWGCSAARLKRTVSLPLAKRC